MSEKHYVVSLHKGIDKEVVIDALNRDTSADSSIDSNIIPDRKVDNVNTRPSSKRIFEISLTDEEAKKLKADPRVGDVNTPLVWTDDWLDYEQGADWTREVAGDDLTRGNWGLLRQVSETNAWGLNTTNDLSAGTTYDYHLDGTGVDYIHQEGSKFRYTHEQWQDRNGVSRLVPFQWNTLPNCSAIGTIDYTNTASSSGHATHCCGTAVGKDYGWAKNSAIYNIPYASLDQAYWFDAIKEFHRAKAVDPITGFKRPTVVSASWGSKGVFNSMTDIQFRGSSVGSVKSPNFGMTGDSSSRFNTAGYGLSAEVEEMQDEGIHYFKSAGNQKQKLCFSGDIDYNNHVIRSVATGSIAAGDPVYYNRGAGNIGPDTIVVGNLDSALYNNLEATNDSSDKGPRVDVWAAGTAIVSAYNTNDTATYQYDGTSMSTPQVAGMSCLLLQLNPGWTPTQLRKWWHDNSIKDLLWQGSVDENTPSTFFANDRSLMNGTNRIAYFPYAVNRALTMRSD